MTNFPTNPPNLHTPTSSSKKLETNVGDRKKQLKLEQMFYENVVWQKVDDVFRKLSKRKPLFLGSIVEMPGIWHLLQCNLVDSD
jgi:hypothetical protein